MATVWNVFLPLDVLNQRSAYLKGQIDESKCLVCISGFYSRPEKVPTENIVGTWASSGKFSFIEPKYVKRTIWLEISRSSIGLECRVHSLKTPSQCGKCIIVLFDHKDLFSSLILREHINIESHFVGHLLSIYSHPLASSTEGAQKAIQRTFVFRCLKCLFARLLQVFTLLLTVVEFVLSVLSFRWLRYYVSIQPPVTISHVGCKLHRYRKVLSSSDPSVHFVLFDAGGQQVLDSLLGIAVMAFIMYSMCADDIAHFVIHWADDTAENLNDLIHWLMGAPAGLKLNAQLTGYLGHFFLYHIYLWKGYLSVLRPVLGWVVWCAACSGLSGVTMQFCLVQDILSMLTVHIYCFYVYAARIYSLQVYALSSLWRLFRGKKWNVLRLRVDSALYNIDQLFVGTLLFTVLLFLLPTTALYYFVFTSLRLLTLSFHWLLSTFVFYINNIPASTLLLRLLHSKTVTGDVMFTVKQGGTADKSLVLSMETTHLAVGYLYKWAQSHLKSDKAHQHKYTWGDMLRRLAAGSLLYPWVDPQENAEKENLS